MRSVQLSAAATLADKTSDQVATGPRRGRVSSFRTCFIRMVRCYRLSRSDDPPSWRFSLGGQKSIVDAGKGCRSVDRRPPCSLIEISQRATRSNNRRTLVGSRYPLRGLIPEIREERGKAIRIEHKRRQNQGEPNCAQDPRVAVVAMIDDGCALRAEPRRKPEHFEILGRSAKDEELPAGENPPGL